jgi:hypothetical protein
VVRAGAVLCIAILIAVAAVRLATRPAERTGVSGAGQR